MIVIIIGGGAGIPSSATPLFFLFMDLRKYPPFSDQFLMYGVFPTFMMPSQVGISQFIATRRR